MTALTPWITDVELTDEARLVNINLPSGITLAGLCDSATSYRWAASGAQFNARDITVRPSRLVASCGCGWGPFGMITPFGQGWGGCQCDAGQGYDLSYPASVTTVTVDGVALAASAWSLYDRRTLVRNALPGAPSSWPCCQD
ncbi:MAG: hypothetical protein ABIQ32_10410, partial [Sphingomicrobium sp.]